MSKVPRHRAAQPPLRKAAATRRPGPPPKPKPEAPSRKAPAANPKE